jgi:hypothetical protein
VPDAGPYHETVEPFRARIHESEGFRIRGMLADWTTTQAEQLTDAWTRYLTTPTAPESRGRVHRRHA